MMTFLEKLARQILQQNCDFTKTAIVLPGRRAGRVLLKQMSEQKQQIIFTPAIFTINDFIKSFSPFELAPEEELLKMTFEIYKSTSYGEEKSFDMFYPWGETFLRDINEIDMQLADAKAIFANLSEIKELDISFAQQELSENQRKYLDFYKNLFGLYEGLNRQLKQRNLSYWGAIYRDLALNIDKYTSQLHFEKIYFAGLSAFTPSEFKIIEHFLSTGKAEIYFDFDPFYANTSDLLIQKIKQNLGEMPIHWVSNDYKSMEKSITEVAVSGKFNQLYCAINKIQEIERIEGSLDNTALVFADESLVLPFLHAYPCGTVNLTMGYPFSETPAVHLVKQLITLVKNCFRFQEIRDSEEPLYYHKDIIAILENPVIRHLLVHEKSMRDFLEIIKKNNKSFFKYEEIVGIGLQTILPKPEKGVRFFEESTAVIQNLIAYFPENVNYSYSLRVVCQKLMETADFLKDICHSKIVDFNTISYFFDKKIRTLSVPLKGEYDKGLQVMGLLESRTLDFKNVILVSANEGVLPNSNAQNSLILFDMKRYFGLPLTREKDTVFAYHFFRLLQRAEDIVLIYDEDASDTLAERSRFVAQLEFEVKAQHCDNIHYNVKHFTIDGAGNANQPLIVKKDKRIIDHLETRVYSASLLSKYINCKLQFYFHAVLGLKRQVTVSEEMEQNTIGTIIHNVLEKIVNQIIVNPQARISIIKEAVDNLDRWVDEEIVGMEDLKHIDLNRGKPFLYKEIIKKYLNNYLTILGKDTLHSIEFLECEKEITTSVQVNGKSLHIKGFIDRIDRIGQRIRIVDYKTGRVDPKDMRANNIEELFSDPTKNKIFQLMIYLFMYCKYQEDNEWGIPLALDTGIISFVQLNKEQHDELFVPVFEDYSEDEYSPQNLYDIFKVELTRLLEEILNPEIDFDPTSDIKRCGYCDYLEICGRQKSKN
ncbi:PD-(D/E)XK nuclease family protein [Bacteroidales bacterium OttesenSCG-928-B11]|nr:PD-(D/E)XK nuclease family protein [Bacteroidales bacterium OttesenSCG-928-B11]MDL2326583.1 PD-(D/E)XK nuclease family protein [Bacteroidales bacterium OttesenSCG-928-A14]